jgi:hypothetical protein
MRSSSEAEPRSRGPPAPERGGASLGGGGGGPAHGRGRTSPEGATSPRARRRFASAVSCPSSEAEFRPRVAGPTVWWAVGATCAVGL